MSRLSLKQAAEFAGTTKPTILKHITRGKVSGEKGENGEWSFDLAELVRAYGEPSLRTASGNTSLSSRNHVVAGLETPSETVIELATLRAQLGVAEQERERERRDKDATIADLRARLDSEAEERRRLTLLLTDGRSREPAPPLHSPSPPIRRGWWAQLIKRG